jgi:hypothetical protein
MRTAGGLYLGDGVWTFRFTDLVGKRAQMAFARVGDRDSAAGDVLTLRSARNKVREYKVALTRDGVDPRAPCNNSIGCGGRIGREKGRRLSRERVVKLKEGPVPGIGVGEKNRVWQMGAQPIGIRDRDHLVMDAIDDEHRLSDRVQFGETLPCNFFPFPKGRHLGLSYGWAGNGLAILLTLHQPCDESRAGGLTRLCRREKQLLQYRIAFKFRIGEMPGKVGLLEVHDVLATPRRRAHENHPAENRRPIDRHLLRHHAAQGKSKDVADLKAKAIEECQRVIRHSADRLRHCAGGSAKPGAFKQNHLTVTRERIRDGRIPIIERAREVLQAQQRQTPTRAKAAIRVSFLAALAEHGRSVEVAGGL